MKTISNIDEAISHIVANNPNWVQEVYDRTGIWARYYQSSNGSYISLVNKCGVSSINDEYSDVNEKNESVKVYTIDELIDCIISSDSYSTVLNDSQIGLFSKSELFWGIVDFVILPKRTDPQRSVFPFIEKDDYRIEQLLVRGDTLELSFDLCGYTRNSSIININHNLGIKECIAQITDIMEEWVVEITSNNCPAYDENDEQIVYQKFAPEFKKEIKVPESLSELMYRFKEVFVF